jgi:hypothetical protein
MVARILQALFLVLAVLNFAWYIDAGVTRGLIFGVFFIVVTVTMPVGEKRKKNDNS